MKRSRIMNKLGLIVLSLSLTTSLVHAQILSGKVTDAESNAPLPYAAVSVNDTLGALVTGRITEDGGNFNLEIKPGLYTVIVEFMGYKRHSQSIDFKGNLQLKVSLTPNTEMLEAVIVEGQRTKITQMIDKKVITVGEDLLAEGGSALDVMNNLPEIKADQDGAITLRGNANVRILVNGKPSPLSSSELLKQMPASQIVSVEVITSPSAKYQADGMSGIINIITKAKVQDGIFTNLGTSLNTLGAHNHNVSTTVGGKNINLRAGVNFNRNRFENENSRERRGIQPFAQSGDFDFSGHVLGLNAGVDWFPTAKDELSFNINFNDNQHLLENNTVINQANTIREQKTTSDHIHRTLDYNVNYRKLFSENNFLEVDLQRSNNENLLDGKFFPRLQILDNYVDNNVQINNAALDYFIKFSEKSTLEAGYLFNGQQLENSRIFFREELTDSVEQFTNTQTTHSFYSSYTYKLSKLQIKAGIRMEHFVRNANFGSEQDNKVNQSMTDLFPSLHMQYGFSEALKLNLGYNRRTSRPSLRQVNPNPLQFNEFFVMQGNPNLDSEFSNNLDLSLNVIANESFSITPSIYARRTNDLIVNDVSISEEGVNVMSFINGTTSNTIGASLGFSLNVAKWWNTRVDGNFSYEKLEEPIESFVRDYQRQAAVTFNNDLQFNKVLSATILYTYEFPYTSYFNYWGVTQYLDLGVRVKILKQKGAVGIRVSDVFNTMVYQGVNSGIGFEQDFHYKPLSRIALVSFNYKIGKSAGKTRKRKNRNYGSGFVE